MEPEIFRYYVVFFQAKSWLRGAFAVGNAEVERLAPVESYGDIMSLRRYIASEQGCSPNDIQVLNYKRIS